MSTQQWMAAFVAMFFVVSLYVNINLQRIAKELQYMNGRVDVRIVNTGFDTTNYPPYNWRLEHP